MGVPRGMIRRTEQGPDGKRTPNTKGKQIAVLQKAGVSTHLAQKISSKMGSMNRSQMARYVAEWVWDELDETTKNNGLTEAAESEAAEKLKDPYLSGVSPQILDAAKLIIQNWLRRPARIPRSRQTNSHKPKGGKRASSAANFTTKEISEYKHTEDPTPEEVFSGESQLELRDWKSLTT